MQPAPLPGSLWLDGVSASEMQQRSPLPSGTQVDVAIVGGGYTGLWTAWHLIRQDPALRVVVLERDVVGFGASGRNGGWCSGILPTGLDRLDRQHGRGAGAAMQRAVFGSVDDVVTVCEVEAIKADVARGGWINLARTRQQVARLQAETETFRRHGFDEEHLAWLGPAEAAERVAATDVLGATFMPRCAAVHPFALVRGLARAVERRGVVIHEHTAATAIEAGGIGTPSRVVTERGVVRADVVVRATEAYTRDLPGLRRRLLPIYSLMIATKPLSPATWESIGLHHRETFGDARREVIYGQRTADGRLAFGGRGAPYHFGSAIDPGFDRDERVRRSLIDTLVGLFPQLGPELDPDGFTHHWGGPLGASRDWEPFVRFNRRTGLAEAGGYVGDGVAMSNLAGNTLADLILDTTGPLVNLPWVGHRSRPWEPEPIRWVAVNGALRLARRLDRSEEFSDRSGDRSERRRSRLPTRLLARALDRLTGS